MADDENDDDKGYRQDSENEAAKAKQVSDITRTVPLDLNSFV
jgi:hypothetical protein